MSDLFWLTPSQLGRIRPYSQLAHSILRIDDRHVVTVLFRAETLRLHPLNAWRRDEGEMDRRAIFALYQWTLC
ncbi:hypothetical protein RS75_22130 [Rhizobium nepotum 39/7]|uniref:Transposase n=1 Tax=Rhizobium nepotum 39/7 TaxID=1368418 RepID=A0ABR5CLI8_9HYPH|nr:hypothetical protein RS75_22130 [Rhizobium nepotum 39/7]